MPDTKWTVAHLEGEDGDSLLIRGTGPAEILRIARDFVRDYEPELVLLDELADVRVGQVRALPCRDGGHELDGAFCEGRYGRHYLHGRGGPGSFSGAFLRVDTAKAMAGTETT